MVTLYKKILKYLVRPRFATFLFADADDMRSEAYLLLLIVLIF